MFTKVKCNTENINTGTFFFTIFLKSLLYISEFYNNGFVITCKTSFYLIISQFIFDLDYDKRINAYSAEMFSYLVVLNFISLSSNQHCLCCTPQEGKYYLA